MDNPKRSLNNSQTVIQQQVSSVVRLSIIIPVYNEQGTIAEIVERVIAVTLPGVDKEIIIIDDGSTDHSAEVIQQVSMKYPQTIKTYTSIINLGKGSSIRLGIKLSTGDILLIQDADLELNPEDYPRLLKPVLDCKSQVVYGSRFLKQTNQASLKSRLANGFLTTLTNLLFGGHLTDMSTGYKIFTRDVILNIPLRSARFEFEPEVTAKLLAGGHKIIEVPITYTPRTGAQGKKIGVIDGIEYIITLLKYRYFSK